MCKTRIPEDGDWLKIVFDSVGVAPNDTRGRQPTLQIQIIRIRYSHATTRRVHTSQNMSPSQ